LFIYRVQSYELYLISPKKNKVNNFQ